jgi:hypothetical protein
MVEKCGLYATDSGLEPVADCRKHDKELPGSIKGKKFP